MHDINFFYNESSTRFKTRENIILKTVELVVENGIDNLSMLEISEAAGITTRNLYRYYSSKELLIVDCTYYMFYISSKKKISICNVNNGYLELEKLLNQFIQILTSSKSNINFTKYIMFFDIYIATIPVDHPAFLKYRDEYRPHIIDSNDLFIKNALLKGILDGSILIKIEDVDLYVNYIAQSIFSLSSRINIKEYENENINKDLLLKHVEIILKHIGAPNGSK